MQSFNARRQADLDALQSEADTTVARLREQQAAVAGREREAAAREKHATHRCVCTAARGLQKLLCCLSSLVEACSLKVQPH